MRVKLSFLITKPSIITFEGYFSRNINKLNEAFDTVFGTIKLLVTDKEGIDRVENDYFKDLTKKWDESESLSTATLNNSSLDILNMEVVDGKIGTAKILIKVGNTTFIDILSLQKVNSQWKITNKIYTVLAE